MGVDLPDGGESLTIRATSKPYSGFLGTIVTPKQKNYPEGAEGVVLEILDNLDNIPPGDIAMVEERLDALLSNMSYEQLRDIYEYNANSRVESALYQSWLTTQRSGQLGIGLSRSTGAESEPNNNKASANAVSADTTLGYLTAYDEDWYSITVNSGADWVIETHASSASDNVGDTKLYLYSDTSSTNHIAYDNDGGTGSYSKISHRFDNVATLPTNLFFSEYAEGSSNNKYLEIYNGTGAAVDLSAYSISTCSNGCNDTTS
ncbi:MAG: hypothetical protein QF704_17380, partial [Anaerolineales bacterium]|nr:hypothetical protein [Anaerolineales bacterium]